MSMLRRDSDTFDGSVGRDSTAVIGQDSTVIGGDVDPLRRVFKLVFGDPVQELLRVDARTVQVRRVVD